MTNAHPRDAGRCLARGFATTLASAALCCGCATNPDVNSKSANGSGDVGVDAATDVGAGDATIGDVASDTVVSDGAIDVVDAAASDTADAATGDSATGDTATSDGATGPSALMSFFVTSVGMRADGNLEGSTYGVPDNYDGTTGLAAADAFCVARVAAASLPAPVVARTWHAYLSVTPSSGLEAGVVAIDAKSRIGAGPWFNWAGVQIASDVASLHTTGITAAVALTELGAPVTAGERVIVTGTGVDGTWDTSNDYATFGLHAGNCLDWTNNDSFANTAAGYVDAPSFADAGVTWNHGLKIYCNGTSVSGAPTGFPATEKTIYSLYCFGQ
ncbi:MAG: hypothetical protein ACHREM_18395 [Polyangiales bacterium]